MSFDAAIFVTHFPEFADGDVYTSALITFWSGVADKMLNVDRWDDLLDTGLELLTAHFLTLAVQNADDAANGSIPGSTGMVSSESIGPLSSSYDNSAIAEINAGDYNASRYGRQFIRMARIVGMGGFFA